MGKIHIRNYLGMNNMSLLYTGSIFILLVLLVNVYNQTVFAQSEKGEGIDDSIGRVLNNSGAVLGLVKDNGQITNRFGAPLGSVDDDGTIYNVSKIVIGKVNPSTRKVFNQSGTVLGSVTPEGDVFNNNGNKLGAVLINYENTIMVGGAARLFFLK